MCKIVMMNVGDKYISLQVSGKVTKSQLSVILKIVAQLPAELVQSFMIDTVHAVSNQLFTAERVTEPDPEFVRGADSVTGTMFADNNLERMISEYCSVFPQNTPGQIRDWLSSRGITSWSQIQSGQAPEDVMMKWREYCEYIGGLSGH